MFAVFLVGAHLVWVLLFQKITYIGFSLKNRIYLSILRLEKLRFVWLDHVYHLALAQNDWTTPKEQLYLYKPVRYISETLPGNKTNMMNVAVR